MNQIIEFGGVEQIPLYNCSAFSPSEWTSQFGQKRPFIGYLSISYGIIMEALFIPCLLSMFDNDLFRISCYKIMFVVGIVDMFALVINSILTGIFAIEGAVFCSHPVLIYFSGLFGLGLWCCSCASNVLLLINRSLNIGNFKLSEYLFSGYRTFFFLLICAFYGLYFVFFTPTCVFSSKYYAWFYDPFIFPNRTSEYTNIPHGINNVLIILGTFFFYGYICFFMCKASKASQVAQIQTHSHQILYQSIAICIINQISSSVYVLMNFIIVPEWLIVLAQLLWQLNHGAADRNATATLMLYISGCPVIIYMTMNATIRSRFFEKISLKKKSASYIQAVGPATTIRTYPRW